MSASSYPGNFLFGQSTASLAASVATQGVTKHMASRLLFNMPSRHVQFARFIALRCLVHEGHKVHGWSSCIAVQEVYIRTTVYVLFGAPQITSGSVRGHLNCLASKENSRFPKAQAEVYSTSCCGFSERGHLFCDPLRGVAQDWNFCIRSDVCQLTILRPPSNLSVIFVDPPANSKRRSYDKILPRIFSGYIKMVVRDREYDNMTVELIRIRGRSSGLPTNRQHWQTDTCMWLTRAGEHLNDTRG